MSVHAPARQINESQADYRARRAESNAIAHRATHTPTQAPAIGPLDVSRFFTGVHTNPERNKARRALRLAKFARSQWLSHFQKQVKPRKHKQHVHTRRDDNGVITLIGKSVDFIGGVPRDPRYYEIAADSDGNWTGIRIWLGGISAQRGY